MSISAGGRVDFDFEGSLQLARKLWQLADDLVTEDHEIVGVLEGEGATPAVTRQITEWLSDQRPDVEVEVHHGGQPLYPYCFGVE